MAAVAVVAGENHHRLLRQVLEFFDQLGDREEAAAVQLAAVGVNQA